MSFRPATTAFRLFFVLLIALCCLPAYAQSGRRKTSPPPPAPAPSPTPEAAPTPKPKNDEDQFNFFVATGDRGARVSRAPLTFHEAATNGCADQLRKRTSLDVDVSLREVTRGEAIAKAKSGDKTYVVLVTLVEDTMRGVTQENIEFEVDYVVFAPVTAKVLASGRTYESSARKGPISIPRPRGISLPSFREELLRRAGQDAADRIVKSVRLNDPAPPTTKVATK